LPDEIRVALAFGLALATTLAATPVAIWIAHATSFYDHPIHYKRHSRPTPYLGGAAVAVGLLLSSVALGRGLSGLGAIVLCAAALLAVGTADDRYGLGVLPRLAVEVAVGAVLFAADLGWSALGSDPANLALTIIFVIGVINALNLMDNIDGAAGTVSVISALGLGALALLQDRPDLAPLAFALAGACAGFLPYNLLARPARIFLGDGGSMVLGFVLAALIMTVSRGGSQGLAPVVLAVVVVGLPALDTALVVVSRLRRGAGVFSGGRDHLTHRLLTRLGDPRRVAVVIAAAQGVLLGLAIVLHELGGMAELLGAGAAIVLGVGVIATLEMPGWARGLLTSPNWFAK
jgi:UDP-GlcNAc:undecaprenyl-phosphate/decaprenyl-phosphate GlcNAc-1-phosphate transferase